MSAKIRKQLELAAYGLLLVVSVGIALRLSQPKAPAPAVRQAHIQAGAKLSALPVDWATNGQTLVLALQVGCGYCAASAPFYRRLAAASAEHPGMVHLLAVLPQEAAISKRYLASLSVPVADVRKAGLAALGVSGTPTLALVNRYGVVNTVWNGTLSAAEENALLRTVGLH